MPGKFSIHTIGCKVNQHDSAVMASLLRGRGMVEAKAGEGADICLVNTCTVTAKSDYQSRQMIRRAVRENPGARVIVTGCYSQVRPGEVKTIEGVSSILENKDKKNIIQHINKHGLTDCLNDENAIGKNGLSAPLFGDHYQTKRARAFLGIQEGCNNRCTYCVVWKARGKSRSVPVGQVIAAAREIEARGFPEIVLTGVHIGFYGRDGGPDEPNLYDLLIRLLKETSRVRFRISSIEPNEVGDGLMSLLANEERACRHLHIPLQSASDGILKRMGRGYSARHYFGLVERLKVRIPGICIGADIIAGFPGETDDIFNKSLSAVENSPIDYLHVFPYSKRKDTVAAGLDGQVPEKVKSERSKVLRRTAGQHMEAFYRNSIGTHVNVIAEQSLDNSMIYKCISDNYLKLFLNAEEIDPDGETRIVVRPENVRSASDTGAQERPDIA